MMASLTLLSQFRDKFSLMVTLFHRLDFYFYFGLGFKYERSRFKLPVEALHNLSLSYKFLCNI